MCVLVVNSWICQLKDSANDLFDALFSKLAIHNMGGPTRVRYCGGVHRSYLSCFGGTSNLYSY